MSSSHSSKSSRSSRPPVTDPSAQAVGNGIRTDSWMIPTVIDDNDLMFGGKSLRTWYEEERRRQSLDSSIGAEERRGRPRERSLDLHHGHHHHHHHHHEHKNKDGER